MEQLKAESSEKKRTGILLQFKKTQVERDKSFKVVPIDSLPEEEQDEARKLLKLREEIADRWAETVRMEDGKYVDHPDLDSAMHEFQKIDDEFRRRGWTVAVPGAGTSFFDNLNQAIHDLSESYKGMSPGGQLQIGCGLLIVGSVLLAIFGGTLYFLLYALGLVAG